MSTNRVEQIYEGTAKEYNSLPPTARLIPLRTEESLGDQEGPAASHPKGHLPDRQKRATQRSPETVDK